MGYRVVEEKRLLELLAQDLRLCALDAGGVDNWTWYGENFHEFLEEYKDPSDEDNEDFWFEDVARKEIEGFPQINEGEMFYGEP